MSQPEKSSPSPFEGKDFDELVKELALSDRAHSCYGLGLFIPELWECGLARFDQVRMVDEHPPYERMLYVSKLLPELLKTLDRKKEDVLVVGRSEV